MKAYESTARITNDRKLEALDLPWDKLSSQSIIRVIVMVEDDEEDEILDSPVESFRQAWREVKEGKVTPIELLMERLAE